MNRSRRLLHALAAAGIFVGIAILYSTSSDAVGTRSFALDTAPELSAGVLDRVSVRSDGTVVIGEDTQRIAPADTVASVWSLLELGDGSVLAGTGVDGRIYRVADGRATLYAQTDAVVVTALARTDDGTVYAATLPDGKVFRVVPPAGARVQPPVVVAELPGVQHVWAIAWDRQRNALLCATGPEGKLFAVDPRGRAGSNATVVFDSEEPHLYSLALSSPGGEIFVGAGGGHAIVYGVRGVGQARVLARLAGDEVKSLSVAGDDVWAASNEFTEPPEPPRRMAIAARLPTPGGPATARPRPGRGNVYRIRPSGLAERYYNNFDSHVMALQWDATRREVWVALGVGGRVLALSEDRTSRIVFDVDEQQVGAIALTGRTRMFASSDTGAFYVLRAGVPTAATWHSKVLDGVSPCRWGALRWRGSGALDWETRSGNTELPDATWSPWEPLDTDGVLRSPSSRYVQVRARFGRAGETELRSVQVYYLPENQRPVVSEVTAIPPETKVGETRSSAVRVTWKVDNPDSDSLRYRLRFRGDSERTWRPLLRNQEHQSALTFDWVTDGLPEGFYRVEVEASDEASNPEDNALRDRRESDPVLVDNTPPAVTVSVAAGRVTGTATDGASAVTRVEVSVDGGEWRAARAADGVLDERTERFEAGVPAGPRAVAGEHAVSVRAYDEAGNLGVASERARW